MVAPKPPYDRMKTSPKFDDTFCSQCGGSFGPGDSSYSHCDQHQGLTNLDDLSPSVRKVMKQFESGLVRRRAYGPPSNH